jgi:hypothetical protein
MKGAQGAHIPVLGLKVQWARGTLCKLASQSTFPLLTTDDVKLLKTDFDRK